MKDRLERANRVAAEADRLEEARVLSCEESDLLHIVVVLVDSDSVFSCDRRSHPVCISGFYLVSSFLSL